MGWALEPNDEAALDLMLGLALVACCGSVCACAGCLWRCRRRNRPRRAHRQLKGELVSTTSPQHTGEGFYGGSDEVDIL